MNLTRFDIIKICGYAVAFLTGLYSIVGPLITPFGANNDLVSRVTAIVGALILFATLISNTLKNPSPPAGMTVVHAPVDASPPLTSDELSTSSSPPPTQGAAQQKGP